MLVDRVSSEMIHHPNLYILCFVRSFMIANNNILLLNIFLDPHTKRSRWVFIMYIVCTV